MTQSITRYEEFLTRFVETEIRFVLVGDLAAVAHGSSYMTQQLDICYERSPANIQCLVPLLNEMKAHLNDAPGDLPVHLDEKIFSLGMNFSFESDLGAFDLWGKLAGLGLYPDVLKCSEPLDLYGVRVDILSLAGLIKVKEVSGRPIDLVHVKELKALTALKAGLAPQ